MAAYLTPPTGVTVRYQGQAALGTSQFWYWIQAQYTGGYSTLSALATTGAKCPAAFSQSNFVAVEWNAMPGAIGYIVWRTTTSTPPTSGTNELFVATSETGIKDDGNLPLFSGVVSYNSLVRTWRALYSFAVDGGAISTITPVTSDTIPANALVVGGVVNPTTAPVGAGASVAVGTSAGSSSSSIMAATAITSLTIDALIEVLGTNSQAATNKPSFKMTAAGQITVTISADALTAGVIEIWVMGFVATNP